MSPRDRRYSRTVGIKPFSGHRYVFDGQVRIEWVAGGKRYTRTIGTNTATVREEADGVLEEALAEARGLASGQRKAPVLSVSDLLVQHRADAPVRHNPRTRAVLRAKTLDLYDEYQAAILKGIDGSLAAAQLRKSDVRRWMMDMRLAGTSEGTIARRVDYLKQAYRWAHAEVEILDADPIAGFKGPSRDGDNAPYTPDEGRRLLETLLGFPAVRAWRFRAMVIAEAMYGARANQVLGLQWRKPADIDFDQRLTVQLADEDPVTFEGSVTFRQAVVGSKGQKDRTLPLLPIAREAFLEAWNHQRSHSPWVFWCHRDASEHSPYGSMHHMLEQLEEAAGVDHVPYRAFHGFRRALATAIVEALGVSQASKWIADTPAVIMRRYVRPTEEAKTQAAIYLVKREIGDPKPQSNRNIADLLAQSHPQKAAATGTYGTGAAGLEPATCLTDPRKNPDVASAFLSRLTGKADAAS